MSPDRGETRSSPTYSRLSTSDDHEPADAHDPPTETPRERHSRRSEARRYLASRASEPQNFTLRGVLVGLAIGVVICFSNMYFGLQTGWVSSMSMPSALIGFAYFKTVSRLIAFPFSPVENVLVQSVAGSVGTMPLGCGFVGVIPALDYLLKPEEGGPLRLSTWKLVVWAVGIAFFGVVFAVPLRREVIIREKLKFPSGTATALMIGVLHGDQEKGGLAGHHQGESALQEEGEESEALIQQPPAGGGVRDELPPQTYPETREGEEHGYGFDERSDWKAKIRLLIISFVVSAVYTLFSYFVPQVRGVPVFGLTLARDWLWTLNPSPAYVGQGIIMGPETTLHMLLGAILGWGILSPLAKSRGWAPGPVSDWTTGSKGWIVWVSLAIMLADSLVSLGWLILRPLILYGRIWLPRIRDHVQEHGWKDIFSLYHRHSMKGYSPISSSSTLLPSQSNSDTASALRKVSSGPADPPDVDAPPEHLISTRTTLIGLVLSIALAIGAVHWVFTDLIPIYLTLFALVLALLLSIMGVRALGETDLNPVSGISKLTQLLFAFVTPASNKNAVIINLLAGAISESGALQAGDLMQDLKTGHLLGAAPNAQFWGQIIGSAVGAVLSAVVYRLYTRVYEVPGELFQVPTGYVWVFTARLVTGQGLPPMVGRWAAGAGLVFAVATVLRTAGNMRQRKGGWRFVGYIPGGIAVAVGMYNVPSFTLARTIGGLLNWYWRSYRTQPETPVVVLASGLILGEGVVSIVNLLLASLDVPHL
ncbi:OPT super [Coniosporium apollinis]|uniref:OPT super n=1 Tax=Coniosporium apollinis TaxID=61459 RepID=A0ABQ9NZ22_9PEZI|nr:OPT super [Coniosporium apollinis]